MLKGIIYAGGNDARLYPITRGLSKQLLPVFDKPMIYYPLSTLMLAGIRDILVITGAEDRPQFERLLGNGAAWGLRLSYIVQPKPDGMAQSLMLAGDFIGRDRVAVVRGDNIFFGHGLADLLARAAQRSVGATVFAYQVRDPEHYDVVWFDASGRPTRIVEQPKHPGSNWAVTGLYFYDNDVVRQAAQAKSSARGQVEITDVNMRYLEIGALNVLRMGRGFAWLNTNSVNSLLDAASFVQTLEQRQGMKVACPEEVAYRMGFITQAQFIELARALHGSAYGAYLLSLIDADSFVTTPAPMLALV
jgi:glucose-1-phosphate thymidylyltransferase